MWYSLEYMLRTLRRSLGVPAGLLIIFLAMGASLPAALHGEASDDACEASGGSTGHDSNLRAASPVVVAQHCGICHWLRSLRVFQTDAAQSLPRLLASPTVVTHTTCATPRQSLDPVPARAPPA
jgi:hypothetical protein